MNYKLLVDTAIWQARLCFAVVQKRIVVTVNDPSLEQPITMMKTVNERSTNLSNVIRVNSISRKYCSQEITLEEAYDTLLKTGGKQYSLSTHFGWSRMACVFAL